MQTSDKVNLDQIQSPDPKSGWFPKFNGDFLVQRYTCDKILSDMRHTVAKCPSRTVEESFKKIPYSDLDADDFLLIQTGKILMNWF